jgi:hypothetical protein
MNTRSRISQLENEIGALKNDLQSLLLDVIRENHRRAEGPLATHSCPADGQQAIVNQRTLASEKKPDEETVRAGQPLRELRPVERAGAQDPLREIDVIPISGLARWAEETIGRLGQERTEAVLALSDVMGYLPPDIRHILFNLVKAEPGRNASNIAARDYLDLLARIRDKRRETLTRLLSIPPPGQEQSTSTGVLTSVSLHGKDT